jgi:1-acyl-sn-glycerol-3-phosphate acyltransferase
MKRVLMHGLIDLLYGTARRLYHVQVEGEERLPANGPGIVAMDEISMLGSLVTSVMIFRRVAHGQMALPLGLSLEDIWMFDVMHRLYDVSGSVALPTGRGQSAGVLLQALQHLQHGGLVLISPAGEVSFDGTFVPLQPGAAWLALRSAAPITPVVATRGAFVAWPSWNDYPSPRGRFNLRVGQPFHLASQPQRAVSDEMVRDANQTLAATMQALIEAEDGCR